MEKLKYHPVDAEIKTFFKKSEIQVVITSFTPLQQIPEINQKDFGDFSP